MDFFRSIQRMGFMVVFWCLLNYVVGLAVFAEELHGGAAAVPSKLSCVCPVEQGPGGHPSSQLTCVIDYGAAMAVTHPASIWLNVLRRNSSDPTDRLVMCNWKASVHRQLRDSCDPKDMTSQGQGDVIIVTLPHGTGPQEVTSYIVSLVTKGFSPLDISTSCVLEETTNKPTTTTGNFTDTQQFAADNSKDETSTQVIPIVVATVIGIIIATVVAILITIYRKHRTSQGDNQMAATAATNGEEGTPLEATPAAVANGHPVTQPLTLTDEMGDVV